MGVKLQTIKDIRNYLSAELAELYPENEIRSLANIIFTSVLSISRLKLLRSERELVPPRDAVKVIEICNELKSGKPIQYIIGETIFHGCIIKVKQGVLIPRPETEELVDMIIRENEGFIGKILDIGTGSGCIAVALASNLKGAEVTAIDISAEALQTAAENARLNKVKVIFARADILKNGQPAVNKSDIIVSNPPYVRNSEKEKMHRNVLDYEPHEALFVLDSDPLLFYRNILEKGNYLLNPGGKIYFEINEAMGQKIRDLAESLRYRGVSILKDINGKDRFMKGNRNDPWQFN